jgi:hypothetical protein
MRAIAATIGVVSRRKRAGKARHASLAVVLFAAAIAASASANGCTPTTSHTTFTVHAIGGIGYYLAEDPGWLSCEFGIPECGSIWIYEESNGMPGLQRGDEIVDDTCGGAIPGDTIVF